MALGDWITQPLTMLFRKECFSPEWQKKYKYYRDMHEIYHLLNAGKGHLFNFIGGVYRYHSGGIHSMITREQYCITSLPIDEEFYNINHTPAAKRNYLYTLRDCINLYSTKKKSKALGYIVKHFALSHNLHILAKQLFMLLKTPRHA